VCPFHLEVVGHNGEGIDLDGKISGQVEHSLLKPALAVVIVSSGLWIPTAQPDTAHTSGDQMIVQRQNWIDKF
jgi:hypothetical protein